METDSENESEKETFFGDIVSFLTIKIELFTHRFLHFLWLVSLKVSKLFFRLYILAFFIHNKIRARFF